MAPIKKAIAVVAALLIGSILLPAKAGATAPYRLFGFHRGVMVASRSQLGLPA